MAASKKHLRWNDLVGFVEKHLHGKDLESALKLNLLFWICEVLVIISSYGLGLPLGISIMGLNAAFIIWRKYRAKLSK